MPPAQLELFNLAQSQVILLEARKEVMQSLQQEIASGCRKPPSERAFVFLTHAIQRIYNRASEGA